MSARPSFLDLGRVNRALLAKQRLAPGTRGDDVVEVVREICGLHATAATTPYLSLWSRVRAFRRRQLDEELYERRRLVRALCMRGTLHIVPADELPLYYQATTGRLRRSYARQAARWMAQAGLCLEEGAEETLERLQRRIADALAEAGPTTVSELGERVPELQLKVQYAVNKPYAGAFSLGSRLVPGMCTLGLLVRARPRGSWRSSLYEYAPLADWLPGLDLEATTLGEAQVRLVRRYLAAFGPATMEDVTWWGGLGKRETRKALSALGDEVIEIEIAGLGGGYLMLAADRGRLREARPAAGPCVNLLPALDPYIMGYRDRDRFLAPERHDQVYDRAGNAFATVWVDGWIAGVWQEREAAIELLIWEEVEREALADQAQRLGRFLHGRDVEVAIGPYPPEVYVKNPFTLASRR